MPFAGYEDFADCVAQNQDKDDPEAYCAIIEAAVKDADSSAARRKRMRFEIVPVFADEDGDGIDDITGEPVEDMEPDEIAEDTDAQGEEFHALLVVEGVWTGDGRYIEEGALDWRGLPLPLMGLDRTTEAHLDARLIGNITRIERVGREIHGYGSWVQSDSDEVRRLQDLVKRGELRGISIDMDAMEYEIVMPQHGGEERIDDDGNSVMDADEWMMRILSARIMGATVVPFPAFEEAFIESLAASLAAIKDDAEVSGWITAMQTYADIDFTPSAGAREEAERGLEWRREYGRGGTEVGVARARDIANGRNLSPDTVNRMLSYFARHEVDKQGEGWSPGEDGFPSAGRIAWALWGGDAGWAWARGVKRRMDAADERGSIVASGHPIEPPVCPPSDWFDPPFLSEPTPLTVEDSGRIFGHLAVWGQCHVGFADRCITPPSSAAAYAHFRTGEILCDDGTRVPVGQITLGTGHADHSASARETLRHYDNTGSAVADVMAGEDEFGIWLAGALRPGLAPERIRELMAADVSGDWRRIGGALELVGVLAVNVPGFPKLRVREAEGLVASLQVRAYDGGCTSTALSRQIDEAIARRREGLAARIGRTREARIAALVERVK